MAARAARACATTRPRRTLGELERDCVLSGGDDYELLFTAPASARDALASLSRELALPLTRIGAIERGKPALVVRDASGEPLAYRPAFDHFR